ncbi:hypothetical protein K070079E91_17400 [Eisenbergiella porci]
MIPPISSSFSQFVIQSVRNPMCRCPYQLNSPDSRGIRVVPSRMMPPPAMSCFMPWLFAYV